LERSCVFASPPEWLGLERLGEIQVHFGGESVRAGQQGERCHPLREGVRIVESPVTSMDKGWSISVETRMKAYSEE
jgi:hypothetical protein